MGDKPREPLECFGCGEDHLLRKCPHMNGSSKQVHNIQEDETVGQVARIVPRIYVALQDRQEDH